MERRAWVNGGYRPETSRAVPELHAFDARSGSVGLCAVLGVRPPRGCRWSAWRMGSTSGAVGAFDRGMIGEPLHRGMGDLGEPLDAHDGR